MNRQKPGSGPMVRTYVCDMWSATRTPLVIRVTSSLGLDGMSSPNGLQITHIAFCEPDFALRTTFPLSASEPRPILEA